jgi:hypothetical protein
LDPLALEAAATGRLCEAVEAADRLMGELLASSSNSSSTIPATQVPVSEFSYLDNRSSFFYSRLRIELHRVLGRGDPLNEWEGWD